MSKHKPIILSEERWAQLRARLIEDNPSSVILIREKMKVVLGFTVRRYRDVFGNMPIHRICLDFYDDPKRTMFLLRYGEFLHDN